MMFAVPFADEDEYGTHNARNIFNEVLSVRSTTADSNWDIRPETHFPTLLQLQLL